MSAARDVLRAMGFMAVGLIGGLALAHLAAWVWGAVA